MAKAAPYGRDRSCTICHREIPDDQSVCLATEECLDRHVERCIAKSVSMRNMHDADPDLFRNTILSNHQQKGSTAMAPKADTTSKPREKKVKAPTFCRFSGEPTGGGKFQPGRDASLKGVLNRMAKDGDVDALVELLCYAWPLTDGIDPATEKAARAELKDLDREAYKEDRASVRIKALQDGQSLEDVYGEYLKPKPKAKVAKAEPEPEEKPKATRSRKATAKA